MPEEKQELANSWATVYRRDEVDFQELKRIRDKGDPYDFQGYVSIELPDPETGTKRVVKKPVDTFGFGIGGLQVYCSLVPFDMGRLEEGGQYEIAAHRDQERTTVLAKIPLQVGQEEPREFALRVMGEVQQNLIGGRLSDLAVADKVKDIVRTRVIEAKSQPPTISPGFSKN